MWFQMFFLFGELYHASTGFQVSAMHLTSYDIPHIGEEAFKFRHQSG